MEVSGYICLAFMLVFGVWAIMARRMIASAICLAVASAFSGVLMYLMGAVWAALFEISVCSGLVTVVFICAITLTKRNEARVPEIDQDKKRMATLPIVLIAAGVLLIAFAMTFDFDVVRQSLMTSDSLKEVLWNARQPDIWGQMIVLVTGASAILVFFKERGRNE